MQVERHREIAIRWLDLAGNRHELRAGDDRSLSELLQHEIVVEEMGGETQDVEVSALKKTGLDKVNPF